MDTGRPLGGRYALERRIGGGGMGAIWRAVDLQLQRHVALKLIASDVVARTPEAHRHFEQEAQAVARLRHPHVVQVHDSGVDGGVPYIVMELLEGEDLETRLTQQGRLSPARVAALVTPVARALAAAHAAGLVHRDLKPANLFLAHVDGEEVVKVLDFGLARSLLPTGAPAQAEGLTGTLRYMSPEQLRADPDLDARADLWSLAVVLYRALTGQFPYGPESVGALLRGTFHPPAVAVSQLVPELGAGGDAFFERALHPKLEQRFTSARELAAAFVALVEAGRAAQAATVLVVDDEPDVEVLMRQRFRRHVRDGVYRFVFARDGEEALEVLRQHPDTHAVLCDLNMPRMDGLTFLSRVGEVDPLVKVVIVSAYGDMPNLRTAMNRGAFDFLVKPVDLDDLESTLAKTVRHVAELRRAVRSTEENALLRMFVHGGIVDRMLPLVRGPGGLAGEQVDASVAFLDVADFTAVTRQHPPESALRRLNANFEVILPELESRGGVVDKFLGDAVMAVFQGEGHVSRALDACLAVKQRLQALAWSGGDASPYAHGICMGVDTGPVVSGNVGAAGRGRLDHTVLGDVVNTAARLATVAARDQVLVSETLAARLRDAFDCRLAGERYLPGPGGQPLGVREVVARQGSQSASSADRTSAQVAPAVLEAPASPPRAEAFTAKGPT
ncbi:protein kinase domain-containing protein [Corallococcus carmarthensis]|uniref:Response regulator n=1 Tax=Corallococcus carmarthensis TaxID=2316728 RepID=A0A3A8JIU6_9BACT|nr:protein kinase [Corallococcus carmarthensis]RKG95265.1 response regulator [Corallococcus carmarthensis]